MFDLTPGERRGALVLLALVALAAVHDLVDSRPRPARPFPDEPPAAATATTTPAPESGGAAAPASDPLDLNRASVAELDALPGIGPVLAGRIVAQREAHGPFRSADELLAVPGIGPRLWERLRSRVRVEASRTARDSSLRIATGSGR